MSTHQIGVFMDIKYTDKPITPFGGLTIIEKFYQRSGLQDAISELPLPQPGSNRGYDPLDIVEGFLVSVVLGARRLAHSGLLRHDKVISEIFGWKKGMASESTFSRFFNKFDVAQNDEIFTQLNRWWFEKLQLKYHTVDVDSTVLTRYGTQEGVKSGYNPRKPGRGSHHPIIAFAAEAKMVIQAWMRTGNSASNTDFKEFIDLVLQTLDKSKIGLLRADSGFFGNDVLSYLEEKQLNYIVATKMYPTLTQKIFDSTGWHSCTEGIDICSFEYQAKDWQAPRRIVVVRKHKKEHPKSGGKSLFEEYDEFCEYLYSAFVTNLELSDELIWELYRHRAEAETQIRELKESYALDGFCCEKFDATEAAFRWVCTAYNLMSLYKIALINNRHNPTLATLKFQCIAIASYLVRHSRKTTLVMSVSERRRAFFDGLFQKLEKIDNQTKYIPKTKFLMN
jgi:hypothetical protein